MKNISKEIQKHEDAIKKLREQLGKESSEKYKFYEGSLRDALKQCLAEGRRPLNLKEVYDLRKAGIIKDQWYSTSTIYINGEVRTATLKELENIEELYKQGCRLVYAVSNGSNGLYGGNGLDYDGRFVSVLPEAKRKK